MTNEEALQRLARDENDGMALIAIAENSEEVLKATVERYFSGRERRKRALLTLLVHVSWHAKEFVPGHDANEWVEEFAEQWCREIQREAEAADNVGNLFQKGLVRTEIGPNRAECVVEKLAQPRGPIDDQQKIDRTFQ
jgi:hypothetical protein